MASLVWSRLTSDQLGAEWTYVWVWKSKVKSLHEPFHPWEVWKPLLDPHPCRIGPSTFRKVPRVFCEVRFDPQGSQEDGRGSNSLGAMKGYKKVQQISIVLLVSLIPKCRTYILRSILYLWSHLDLHFPPSVAPVNEFSAGVCKWWNNIAKTYQPVGTCRLGNDTKGCYLGRCPQLLLACSSNLGRTANNTPSFEMVGGTN